MATIVKTECPTHGPMETTPDFCAVMSDGQIVVACRNHAFEVARANDRMRSVLLAAGAWDTTTLIVELERMTDE